MAEANEPGRHALLVGINRYPHYKGEDSCDLNGCVNDTKLVASVLQSQFGFAPDNIRFLHDAAATRQGILDAMDALVERIDRDDVVLFHFSGHGRLRMRPSADLDEGTGRDCTLMPCDTGPAPVPYLDLKDFEIQDWVQRLTAKTRNATLIFDCCHSGTVTRDAYSGSVRQGPNDARSAEVPANNSIASKKGPSGWLEMSDHYVVISGCEDMEQSREMALTAAQDSEKAGILTNYLTKALVAAKPGTTYRDLFEVVSLNVSTRNPTQHPQIEGAVNRELFGIRDIEPLRYVPVLEAKDEHLVLDGGVAHGLQKGSRWAVYPAGTKKEEPAHQLALVEISNVGALQSTAAIISANTAVEVGARCVEQSPALGDAQLNLQLSQIPEVESLQLAEAVSKSTLLQVVQDSWAADVMAYLVDPGNSDSTQSPSLDLHNIKERTWLFADQAGQPVMPLRPLGGDNEAATLVANLEKLARYRNWLSIANPLSNLDVEFNIYHLSKTGDYGEPVNGGSYTFEVGECICFEVINNEPNALYFSVLDFGLTGAVSLLYPPGKISARIEAGKSVLLGTNREVPLSMGKFSGQRGQETFKLFCTEQRSDFSWLHQGNFRSASNGNSTLDHQVEAAQHGMSRHGDSTGNAEDAQPSTTDWVSINRSFYVQRANQ